MRVRVLGAAGDYGLGPDSCGGWGTIGAIQRNEVLAVNHKSLIKYDDGKSEWARLTEREFFFQAPEQTCAICPEPHGIGDDMVTPSTHRGPDSLALAPLEDTCRHPHHYECLADLIENDHGRGSKCPLCRRVPLTGMPVYDLIMIRPEGSGQRTPSGDQIF